MDYEKKYNEALERAQKAIRAGGDVAMEIVQHIFPELRESEDERIRKWLIDYFGSIKKTVWIHRDITCEQILVWLEKQKPAEWGEEDERRIDAICELLENTSAIHPNYSRRKLIIWLKSLRPSWKPGEDEERLINTSISFLKDFADKGYENAVECIDWLKSKLNGNFGK